MPVTVVVCTQSGIGFPVRGSMGPVGCPVTGSTGYDAPAGSGRVTGLMFVPQFSTGRPVRGSISPACSRMSRASGPEMIAVSVGYPGPGPPTNPVLLPPAPGPGPVVPPAPPMT